MCVKPSVKQSIEPCAEPFVEQTVEPSVEPLVKPLVEPCVEPSVEPLVDRCVELLIEPCVELSVKPFLSTGGRAGGQCNRCLRANRTRVFCAHSDTVLFYAVQFNYFICKGFFKIPVFVVHNKNILFSIS
ncbi:unnamed protein product, partial [Brenthis ino]